MVETTDAVYKNEGVPLRFSTARIVPYRPPSAGFRAVSGEGPASPEAEAKPIGKRQRRSRNGKHEQFATFRDRTRHAVMASDVSKSPLERSEALSEALCGVPHVRVICKIG
eukprot:1187383-Prorocentrum_minimum.AAC.1